MPPTGGPGVREGAAPVYPQEDRGSGPKGKHESEVCVSGRLRVLWNHRPTIIMSRLQVVTSVSNTS